MWVLSKDCMLWQLDLISLEIHLSNLLQYDEAPMHKLSVWHFAKLLGKNLSGVYKALYPPKHLWVKLER